MWCVELAVEIFPKCLWGSHFSQMLLPRKSLFFFFFKNIKIVSNNFLPKVFLHSNANPIVKQDIFKILIISSGRRRLRGPICGIEKIQPTAVEVTTKLSCKRPWRSRRKERRRESRNLSKEGVCCLSSSAAVVGNYKAVCPRSKPEPLLSRQSSINIVSETHKCLYHAYPALCILS